MWCIIGHNILVIYYSYCSETTQSDVALQGQHQVLWVGRAYQSTAPISSTFTRRAQGHKGPGLNSLLHCSLLNALVSCLPSGTTGNSHIGLLNLAGWQKDLDIHSWIDTFYTTENVHLEYHMSLWCLQWIKTNIKGRILFVDECHMRCPRNVLFAATIVRNLVSPVSFWRVWQSGFWYCSFVSLPSFCMVSCNPAFGMITSRLLSWTQILNFPHMNASY